MLRYLKINVSAWQHIVRSINALLFIPNLLINLILNVKSLNFRIVLQNTSCNPHV